MKSVKKLYLIFDFLIYYLFKLVQSNIIIAYDILTPRMHTNPGYVWIPLRINSNFGLLLFSNLISMTPGTLSIDYSQKKKALLVHYLYNDPDNTVISEIEKVQEKIVKLTD